MSLPNEKFLNKIYIDKTIKPLVEEAYVFDGKIPTQAVDSQVVLYYKQVYFNIETPNDVALGKTIDPKFRAPAVRSEHGLFPHMSVSGPQEYSLRLVQMALEVDWSEEEMKYVTMENRVQKKQKALATSFANYMNNLITNTVTENWSTSPSAIQQVDVTSALSWDKTTTSGVDPPGNIIDMMEKIEDIAGYNYKATDLFIAKQSYYDLLKWLVSHDYEYSISNPEGGKAVTNVVGVNIVKTNMVKRGMGVMADFGQCGQIFESEPLATHNYFNDENHTYHLQMYRRFNMALTDPKAVCTVKNLC